MKSIIITGISGGLGRALFDQLHPKDVNLLCISRRFLPYQAELAKEQSSRIFLLQKDLRQVKELPVSTELAHFINRTKTDEVVLIHNAGMIDPIGAIGELDYDQMVDAIQVNFTSPMVMTNEFIAAVTETGVKAAQVLYISSGAAKRVIEGWSVYCAAKAGSEMFFDVLAAQYARDERITVANINPGVMDTEMQNKIRLSGDVYFPERERYVQLKEEGKLPSPETVAQRIIDEFIFPLT